MELIKTESTKLTKIATDLAMGESPRWHDGRLWISDWGAQEILSFDLEGNRRVELTHSFGLPCCFDWLPNGDLLVVSGPKGLVYVGERTVSSPLMLI